MHEETEWTHTWDDAFGKPLEPELDKMVRQQNNQYGRNMANYIAILRICMRERTGTNNNFEFGGST